LIVRNLKEGREPVRLASAPSQHVQLEWLRDLYEQNSGFVRDVVARHAGPTIDAEDLVQNVFLVAHRKWERLSRHAQPRAWLHLAALREVWTAHRRERLKRLLPFRFSADPVETEGPESAYQHREASRDLYALLDRLPEKQRTAFILFYVDGLSSAEIGQMLSCPEPTVRTRLFHARRAFAAAAERWRRRTASETNESGRTER
jgi:RNA polymerase sigma-70 factor (ECF subfamily)